MTSVAIAVADSVTYVGFLAGTAVIAVIDARTHLVPNKIIYPLFALGLAGLFCSAALGHTFPRFLFALAAGAGLGALFGVLWYVGGAGFGDVRLAALIGLYVGWFGWRPLYLGLFGAMIAAAAVVLVLFALGRGSRKAEVAYGPYLIAGAWLGLLLAIG